MGGKGLNLTGYLDFSHEVFQYHLMHSKALEARIKEI